MIGGFGLLFEKRRYRKVASSSKPWLVAPPKKLKRFNNSTSWLVATNIYVVKVLFVLPPYLIQANRSNLILKSFTFSTRILGILKTSNQIFSQSLFMKMHLNGNENAPSKDF